MASIREARADDFERVHPLLLDLRNPYVSEQQWRQLFVDHSGLQNDRFGYLLLDGEDVVGFLATTFSERTIRGQKERFCNMSNWIVKDAFRRQSLTLLSKVLALKGVTVTNLSPTPAVLKICEKLGFTPYDKSERIILPSAAPRLWKRVEIITESTVIEGALGGELGRIFRDHQLPYNRHALVRAPEGDSYVMMNRSPKAVNGRLRVPMARVHHVSAPEIFLEHVDRLVNAVVARFGVAGMIVDERMLRGRKVWHSFARPGGPRTGAFRSDTLGPDDIDGLYSEAVLLNY